MVRATSQDGWQSISTRSLPLPVLTCIARVRLFRARKLRYRTPLCGVLDELLQTPEPRLFLFGAQYPPTGCLAIGIRLRLKEFPRIFILPKPLAVGFIKLRLPLLICINARPVLGPRLESLLPRKPHT